MLDVLEKIMIGLLVTSFVALFICYGVILYKGATGDDSFFVRKVYIVNQDFCREEK